jgi:hypothetical protein
MAQLQIVQNVNRSMECSSCGAAGIAACDCGAPYMPAADRAAKAIADSPRKSDRAIAAEIGVSRATVQRARPTGSYEPVKATAEYSAVDTRVGLDGKVRKMPQRKTKPEEVIPTDEEAEESFQADLYDQACWLLEQMASSTRRKFFAQLRRKYHDDYVQK